MDIFPDLDRYGVHCLVHFIPCVTFGHKSGVTSYTSIVSKLPLLKQTEKSKNKRNKEFSFC